MDIRWDLRKFRGLRGSVLDVIDACLDSNFLMLVRGRASYSDVHRALR